MEKHHIHRVNTSINAHFKFGLMNTMTIESADFVPIEPSNKVILNIGIDTPSPQFLIVL